MNTQHTQKTEDFRPGSDASPRASHSGQTSPYRGRIKQGHYYVRAEHPGISGFQDWTRKVESVVAAPKARNHRLSIVREYLANGLRYFRLCDGHLPEFQPVVREVEALRYLDKYPFAEIVEVEAPHTSPETVFNAGTDAEARTPRLAVQTSHDSATQDLTENKTRAPAQQ